MLSYRMHHREFEPPEELRDTIKCFWYNRRERQRYTDFIE